MARGMSKNKSGIESLRSHETAFSKLASELGNLGYIWQGSLTRRMTTCGTKTCGCHTDESKRHGPYVYWSTKKAGRTISRLLGAEEAELLGGWIENRREMDRIMKEMLAISERVAPILLEEARQAASGGGERREAASGSRKPRTKTRSKST